jgi:hypothetical protein
VTAWAVAIGAIGAAVAAFIGWLRDRAKARRTSAAAAARSDAEKRRADAAEAVAIDLGAAGAERQADLEKEIHDAAQARLAHPDASARARVQERWQRTDPGAADVPARVPAAVRDAAAARPGTGAPVSPQMRGKR